MEKTSKISLLLHFLFHFSPLNTLDLLIIKYYLQRLQYFCITKSQSLYIRENKYPSLPQPLPLYPQAALFYAPNIILIEILTAYPTGVKNHPRASQEDYMNSIKNNPLFDLQYNDVDKNYTSLSLADKTDLQNDALHDGLYPTTSHNLSRTVTLTSPPQDLPSRRTTLKNSKRMAHIMQWTVLCTLAATFFIIFAIAVLSLLTILLLKIETCASSHKTSPIARTGEWFPSCHCEKNLCQCVGSLIP